MIPYLDEHAPFPDVRSALSEPNGLLCAGASLCPQRLISAYRCGIFPWYNEQEPLLWWSPDPRCIIQCDAMHVSRSMRRTLNKAVFDFTCNAAFEEVIRACAAPREGQSGTWILPEMIEAYCALHTQGHAHSYECWRDNELVGGVYGVRVGRIFCGESMFSRLSNASKAVLVYIARCTDTDIIDCQVPSDHVYSLGARCIPRQQFIAHLMAQAD